MTMPGFTPRLEEPMPTPEDEERLRELERRMEEENRRIIEESEKLPDIHVELWDTGRNTRT